ncbi:MAG: efflux RND transporter permease subunit, partial [Spirochaetota bacterium]
GNAMTEVNELVKKNVKVPEGVSIGYTGMSEEMGRTTSSAVFAVLLAIVFIYMILASLYESFITPLTILLAIPPAMTGALFSLAITGKNLDINAMIGMLLLMGLVTKNSILLVDFAAEGVRSGMTRKDAVLEAGRKRLRPILMTTFAMLAGMVPLSLGIGQAAAQRQGMGIAIMGGLIVSTIITLVVVPSVFEYIDRFREWVETPFSLKEDDDNDQPAEKTGKTKRRRLMK